MSVPYWCCSDCLRNTPIPDEVLESFRRNEGSFNDLMTCEHCGSTPEKRKEESEATWNKRKERLKSHKRKETPSERYRRWWVGKLCRPMKSSSDFKRVKDVDFFGPPSEFCGSAVLVYEDGTEETVVPTNPNAYKPRKMDVEIKEEIQVSTPKANKNE